MLPVGRRPTSSCIYELGALPKAAFMVRDYGNRSISNRNFVRIDRRSYQAASSGFGMIPAAMAAP